MRRGVGGGREEQQRKGCTVAYKKEGHETEGKWKLKEKNGDVEVGGGGGGES